MSIILYRIENQIAFIGMNRPEKRNSMSTQLVNQLIESLKEADAHPDVKLIVLYGEGKAFSAGGDIDTFKEFTLGAQYLNYMENTSKIIETVKNMNKFVVAAVHGFAAGAGFSVALAADFIVAQKDAKFISSFTNAALTPDLGLIQSLSNRVPSAIIKEWVVTGRVVTVDEAEERGLINRITEEDVVQAAIEFSKELLQSPPLANKFLKYMIEYSNELTSKTSMMQENIMQAFLLQTQDNQEGLLAFSEKRKPNFNGI